MAKAKSERSAKQGVSGLTKLFCYGTLNVHDIQRELWGEAKEGNDGKLLDYELRMWPNSSIFYVDFKPGEYIVGKVYELTDEQLKATDLYESSMYKRVTVKGDKSGDVELYVRNVDYKPLKKRKKSTAKSVAEDNGEKVNS